jgi:hypothetical protein
VIRTANYRPISLLTSFSNVFEKIIFGRLLIHIHAYTLINKVLKAINSKRKVGGIFFDLEEAFDCINDLEFYGVTYNVYMLLKSYL